MAQLVSHRLPVGNVAVHYASGFDPATAIQWVSFEEQQRLWALDDRHDISEYQSDARDQGTTVAALVAGESHVDARLGEILQRLGLEGLEARGIRYLSSGQCRKAMLARALYQQRPLLILDDPLESLDFAAQGQLREALAQWMTPDTSTLLLCRRAQDILPGITHIGLMDGLELQQQGPQKSVRESPMFRQLCDRPAVLPARLPPPATGRAIPPLDPDVPLIALHEVTVGYGGEPVLREFSWTMMPGQHTLIEGPNGCGKSTLLNLVSGENHLAYGQRVLLFGRQRGTGETVWDVKARFGVVSNDIHHRYIKGWRVLDVVVSGFFDSIGLYDDSGAAEHQSAHHWLAAVGMDAHAGAFYHTLSFGQQRLVLLARAMVKHPAILILDEPCVGLDDFYRRQTLALVDMIAANTRTHILFVSHTQGETPRCINQRIRFSAEGVQIDSHLQSPFV